MMILGRIYYLSLGTKRRKIRRNVRGDAMEYGWIRIHNLLVCCATKISPEFRRIASVLSQTFYGRRKVKR